MRRCWLPPAAKRHCMRRFMATQQPVEQFDHIVVGSGSSGCVVANALASNTSNNVLLIEAGQSSDYYPWFHIPVGYLFTIDNPRADWRFRTAPQQGLNGRSILYPRGLGLGGCSLINGMLYLRGQSEDYDSWAESVQDPSWKWDNILPVFKNQEKYHGGETDMHGGSGSWQVEKVRTNWEILHAAEEAFERYGVPRVSDFNKGSNYGVGLFDVTQKSGYRLNAYQAFIGKPRKNLSIIPSSVVDKLLFSDDGTQCIGVSIARKGADNQEYFARKEVVLSAGSVGSVQILERSGIGNGDILDRAGVSVLKHLPGVGENLQDHLQLRMVYEVDNVDTLNTTSSTLYGKMNIAMEYLINRSGPLSAAPSQLGAFVASSPAESRPNLEYHIQPLSLPAFGQDLDPYNAFTASVCNLRPSSRGSVHITSSEIADHPHISPNYLSTENDRDIAVRAIQTTRDIVANLDVKYNATERRPGLQFQSNDELIEAAGDIGTTIFHPVGTCKMGLQSDSQAVVDSTLKVHGISNLRIADCSVMPTITSGNTAAPAMMIGGKCASMILEEEGKEFLFSSDDAR